MDRGARHIVEVSRLTFEHFVSEPTEEDERGNRGCQSEHQRETDKLKIAFSGRGDRHVRSRASVICSALIRGQKTSTTKVSANFGWRSGSQCVAEHRLGSDEAYRGLSGEGISAARSEEHTSELQSRGLISYAVFCL